MVTPRLLPVTFIIGCLASREAWFLRRSRVKMTSWGSITLLLAIGWFPLLMWIANNLWPQN